MPEKIKPFKSIEEQINLLESRGLIIDDRAKAERALTHYNYYRLSGYTLTLRKNDTFFENVKITDVMQIYNFDAELRSLLLYILEYIEVSFRTYIGYCHAKEYGPLGYLNSKNFDDVERFFKFKTDLDEAINDNEKSEIFIRHHREKYEGKFPIWVVVELLSFGTLSRLYKNLCCNTRKIICKNNYGLISDEYIGNWLQGLTILRNICAHRGRLYNRYINFSLSFSSKDKKKLREFGLDIQTLSKQLFTYIFIINKLVQDEEVWVNFIGRFEFLTTKYSFVKISYYGFPENWRDILKRE